MLNGIKPNADAMSGLMTKQDILSHNMANAGTTGFKRDKVGFQQVLDGRKISIQPTLTQDVLQGAFQRTDNSLDLALRGTGYFALQTQEGVKYSRNGAFQLDVKGRLVDGAGRVVLGAKGPLKFEPGDAGRITVDSDGKFWAGGEERGQIRVDHFGPNAEIKKSGEGLLTLVKGEKIAGHSDVTQGFLESSNVNSVEEMVDMLDTLRLFESNQRALRIQDESLSKAINDLVR